VYKYMSIQEGGMSGLIHSSISSNQLPGPFERVSRPAVTHFFYVVSLIKDDHA
jgi:hypothetical protein